MLFDPWGAITDTQSGNFSTDLLIQKPSGSWVCPGFQI